MNRSYFSSLRFRLVLLVLLSVLPALALMLSAASSQRRLAGEEARATSLRLARVAAGNLARSIEGARQLLATLAPLRAVRAHDSAACSALMARLLKQHQGYSNLGAVKPDGNAFCSGIPSAQPVRLANPEWIQRAVRAGVFAAGEYPVGQASGQGILGYGLPVLDAGGNLLAVVYAALDLGWLHRLAGEVQLPEGAALMVFDRQGTILARHPDPEKWVGRPLPEVHSVEALLGPGEGTAEVPGGNGLTRVLAFTPVRGTSNAVYVSAGIVKEAALAKVNRALAPRLAGLALVGVVALVAAWILGDLVILRRVNALARAAVRLTAGELGARADLPGRDEIGMMARIFNDMAERLAATIQAEQHAKEAQSQYTHELDLLNQMSELLQACSSVEEAYAVIRAFVGQFFPDEAGAVFVMGPLRNLIEVAAAWGASTTGERGVFSPEECWALRRGQAHVVEDTGSGLLCKHLAAPLPRAYLCVPLMAQGEALGVLHVSSPSGREGTAAGFTEGKRRLAGTVAEQVSLALANLKLRETLRSQSIRDPLTGLFNRRYVVETLEREVRSAKRKQRPIGVIVLDIDHFKLLNDTFGHDAGDLLLRELGRLLMANLRSGDIACRYGGEEFVLILPEASLEDTRRRAEQLREAAKALQVFHRDRPLGPATLSLGVAAFPEHGETAETLIGTADAALYRAKGAGRDRVMVAE